MRKVMAVLVSAMMLVAGLSACGDTQAPAQIPDNDGTTEPGEGAPANDDTPQTPAPAGIAYQNIHFDFADEIAAYNAKNVGYTTPDLPDIPVQVRDGNDATGVQLVAARDGGATDYYLNALVAGNALVISGDIAAATSSVAGELAVEEGTVTHVPAPLFADSPVDEVINVTTADGEQYSIHTLHEAISSFDVVIGDVESGVYTFAVDKFLLRVDTEGNLVYYRDMGCIGHNMAGNLKPQDTADGRFYTYYMELNPAYRNENGGYSSGLYVVMDSDYREIDYVTLLPNEAPNHTHGEGYLDQHEFVLLAADHYIALSYTPVKVENLDGIGIDGGSEAFVQAGIIQEVKGGQIVNEFNTVDYASFYASAKEANAYADSTDQGTADDFQDYVHINSVAVDPKDDNLIVSMRHQYAVFKFDRQTGEILWILGGDNNQFSGLDDALDEEGNLFIGQHDAKYVSSAVAGNDSTITVFDNHTSFQDNTSRVLEFTLDEQTKTAAVSAIQGSDLDELNGKNHWATHCASAEHRSDQSFVIGWGLNVILDVNPQTINSHPIFSDYNPATDEITFELCVTRNPLAGDEEACFSYRTYKNAD